jgi:hypothetical protein
LESLHRNPLRGLLNLTHFSLFDRGLHQIAQIDPPGRIDIASPGQPGQLFEGGTFQAGEDRTAIAILDESSFRIRDQCAFAGSDPEGNDLHPQFSDIPGFLFPPGNQAFPVTEYDQKAIGVSGGVEGLAGNGQHFLIIGAATWKIFRPDLRK